MERVLRPLDRWQQTHRPTAFVYGVVKKFGDDQGGSLVGLITFYGFLSIFPLLLVLIAVLGFVLHGDPSLSTKVQHSALSRLPVMPADFKQGALQGSTLAVVAGVLGLLWGSLGVANAVQNAVQAAWEIPNDDRRGFVPRTLRNLAFIAVLGVSLGASVALSSLGSIFGHSMIAGVIGLVLAVAANFGLFLGVFVLLGPDGVGWRDHLPGAVVAAVGWQVLQSIGVALVQHNLKHASQLYGAFATVLGLISFLSLSSQLVMYSVEMNVVTKRHLWPRSLLASDTGS